jgi:hypothetical protein
LSFRDDEPSHKERTDPLRTIDEFRAFLTALSEADTDEPERPARHSRLFHRNGKGAPS